MEKSGIKNVWVIQRFRYMTMRLSDDWQGADFIAQHVTDGNFLKIQLKSRLAFGKKYRGKDIYIAFRSDKDWYLFPHDQTLVRVLKKTGIGKTASWSKRGGYSFPKLPKQVAIILKRYKI